MNHKTMRIRRLRTAGWRMPENTVYDARAGAFRVAEGEER